MAPETTGDVHGRDALGRFRRGKSGNPAGRPTGSRNRITLELSELLASEGVEVLRKAVEMAKSGDRLMLRLVVDKLVPRAGRVVGTEFVELGRAVDLAQGVQHVIEAAASGRISMEEARGFAAMLELQRRAIETEELKVRLEALEREAGIEGGEL